MNLKKYTRFKIKIINLYEELVNSDEIAFLY
jgi:hypothetical protein